MGKEKAESGALQVEAIANTLETLCDRLDTHHQIIETALAAILHKTGANISPNLASPDSLRGDILYDKARKAVREAGKASPSYLQRRLGVGYSRAQMLIDMLEAGGVIGPDNKGKPRALLDT